MDLHRRFIREKASVKGTVEPLPALDSRLRSRDPPFFFQGPFQLFGEITFIIRKLKEFACGQIKGPDSHW